MDKKFRSGFVSIIGRPNAGKSTLLNALVGQKVAIVADKPQTTRTSIQGVVTTPDAQVVFVDTPGIHKADSALNKRLMDTVRASLEERDLLLFVADAAHGFSEDDRRAVDVVRRTSTPVALVLNKVDLLKDKAALLPLIEEYKQAFEFAEYVPVSAARRNGLDDLMKVISNVPSDFGCGVLIVEHNMRVVMGICHRIQVLDSGRTIAEGTPTEIKANRAVIDAYLGNAAVKDRPTAR